MSVFGRNDRVVLPMRPVGVFFLQFIIVTILALSPSLVPAEPAEGSDRGPVTRDVKPPTFTGGYEKGEIVVKYKDSVDSTVIKAINSRMNVIVKRKLPLGKNIYLLALPKGMNVLDAIGEFGKIKEVGYARPNYKYKKSRGKRAR